MSAHNFWNNFTHGFMHGMFNSNPFFGCFGGNWGCNMFFNSCFSPFNSFNSNLYFVPNVFSAMNFNQLMPNMSPPMPNTGMIDINKLFPVDNWQVPSDNNYNFQTNIPTFDTFEKSTPSVSKNYSDADTSNQSYDADALKKKWQRKKPNLTQGFYNKVVQVAKRINCSPDDLMALMNSESGIDPSKANAAGSGATGLIQFMPSTAEGLGTTTQALAKMSAEEQMVYVEKCIMNSKRAAGLGNSKIGPGTLYALIFLPARANRDKLTSSGEKYYRQNKGLDIDKDGIISKADLAKRIDSCRA